MVLAGYAVEIIFAVLHLTPTLRQARVTQAAITWNYTTFLNIAFILLAGALFYRFIKSGGMGMMSMMNGGPDDMDQHA
jgi:hypothetical protein